MRKIIYVLGMLIILSLTILSVANAADLAGKIGVLYKCAFPTEDNEVAIDGKITEQFWQYAPGIRSLTIW